MYLSNHVIGRITFIYHPGNIQEEGNQRPKVFYRRILYTTGQKEVEKKKKVL
jgi:hypothetical protein